MNQILKDVVYGKGNRAQCDYMAAISGMSPLEREVFKLLHEGQGELYIQEELHIDRRRYERVEEAVRSKLLLGIFQCINECMRNNIKS